VKRETKFTGKSMCTMGLLARIQQKTESGVAHGMGEVVFTCFFGFLNTDTAYHENSGAHCIRKRILVVLFVPSESISFGVNFLQFQPKNSLKMPQISIFNKTRLTLEVAYFQT